ncbi:MAG: hypothetical protein K6G88_10815 [Lachnospiraceae bacterium]|nr:hypothetical protein [Lachnospiraceae bacterium]
MKFKRLIAGILAVVTMLTATPSVDIMAIENGDTKKASLEYLGELGTVNIGSKKESGSWLKTVVGDDDVFCLDLGKACHTGYTYEASTSTISSNSSNKADALKAKVGYWYDQTKNRSEKAWVYAQCLIWGIQEGITDKDGLKDIIKQVKNNTGYYENTDVYDQIFDISGTVTCNIITWKYKGSTEKDEVQRLMQINSKTIDYDVTKINDRTFYRQRITLEKVDDTGDVQTQATFRFTAKNIKQLYSYQYNGWGDAVTEDVDDDVTKFSQEVKTDSKGKIAFRFTYELISKTYYYVLAEDLANMSSDDKKAIKERLDDNGYKYASDLTKASAEKLIQKDFDDQMNAINNQYVIEEVSSGNDNILSKFVVKSGSDKIKVESDNKVTVTLTKADSWTRNSDNKWPETVEKSYGNYGLAFKPKFEDKYKKVKVVAVKMDVETGRTAQGDATLKGAVYGVYSDKNCTKLVDTYTTNDKGEFTTKDYRCGTELYIKEITPPEGYLKNEKVYPIDADGKKYAAEYNPVEKPLDEQVVKGDISIIKGMTNGEVGIIKPEKNAEFEVYLARSGSYEKAKIAERDILVTDEDGYAKTKELPYGTYIVHQTKGMDETEFCADFYVNVRENHKTYKYYLNNPGFNAYLKIVKKDAQTKKTVLKAGTTYQIYKLNEDGTETLVTQSYSNGNKIVTVDRFVSDESGEIITYEKLKAGAYRVYEVEGPNGFRNEKKFIDVKITNKSYKEMTDENGNKYLYAEYEYFNNETYGKLKLEKTGPALNGFSQTIGNPLVKSFTYENIFIPDAVFELYAKEDIVTQDNQNETWFKAGDMVATITTGSGAEFTSDCGGICSYKLDGDLVEINVPLGKYELREVSTVRGRVLPENPIWDLEFVWNSQLEEYVYDISGNTEDGILKVTNELPKTDISIKKMDDKSEEAVPDTVFGFYSKDNIYDKDGNIIVKAHEKMATVVTDKDGRAVIPFSVPVADEEDITEEAKNTGNYYFLEESISDSYYLSKEPISVHVSYKDQDTRVITAEAVVSNTQTEVEIDKKMIASSVELPGCKLKITDKDGNQIVSWTSGDMMTIELSKELDSLGYSNVKVSMDEKGNLIVNGLLHDMEYTLSETKPVDGYVTASDITFKLVEEATEGTSKTKVLIKGATYGTSVTDGFTKDKEEFVEANENKVVMYDDTTKLEFSKVSITDDKELPGCKLKVTDKETGVVMDEWISTETTHMVEGKYVVGKTYILSETKPADGYVTAADVEFTVLDDGKVQGVKMVDDTTKVEFSKFASDTKKQLKNAKYQVFDSKGKKVYEFTTGKKSEMIEGILKAGETYTFKEVDAPEHYKLAKDVKITIKDTGKVQKLSAVDARIPVVPDTPQTGWVGNTIGNIIGIILLLFAIVCVACVIAKDESKYNFKPEEKDNEEE